MTLFKQIIILICLIFFSLFVGTFIVSTENIREYLNEQLSSHAQDGATSLGIALTAEIRDNDIASLETYTNAMFDSGYYSSITIKDIDDKVLFQKSRRLIIESVPNWFIKTFSLTAPHQQAAVDDGWQTVGVIDIQSYPGFAYEKLWQNAINTLLLYLAMMVSIFLITAIALRWLLLPLIEIRKQADAICNREFPIIDLKPKTVEFMQVISALNKMSGKLKGIFEQQAKMTEELQKQAFQDEVTGLPNRSSFLKQLKYFCESKNETNLGCLIIAQLNDLISINKKYGHIAGNELLKHIARLLEEKSNEFPNSLVARLSGTEFVLLIKSINRDLIISLGGQLQQDLEEIGQKMAFDDTDISHIGIVTTQDHQAMGELLSEADMALRLAQQQGKNAFHLYDEKQTKTQTHGSAEWHDIIMNGIKNNWFQLYFQRAVDKDKNTRFQEIMLRLNHNEQVVSAGIFIPMAEHLEITRFIDRWVIENLITKILQGAKSIYCINLSKDSLQDPSFPVWLKGNISKLSPSQQAQIVIEAPEYNVVKSLNEYKNLLSLMDDYRCLFSIDHFGIGFAPMAYLKDIKIDFIKVHGSYAANIQDNRDVANYMKQIIHTAHNLDVQIISEGIENEEVFELLKSMELDYFQGYHLGKPQPEEE